MKRDDSLACMNDDIIHAAIYAQPRGELRTLMTKALRKAKSARGRRRSTPAGSNMAAETLRIVNRPEEIRAWLLPGHWEANLIMGAFKRSFVGMLIDRRTSFLVLCKMKGKGLSAVPDSFTSQMKRLSVALRKSMNHDSESGIACHPELVRRLRIDIWFCDPHAPWKHGGNENTSDLLRDYMPKGTDLSGVSQTWLNDVAAQMNNRPRKPLGFRAPAEVMAYETAAFKPTIERNCSRTF